jgi:hypothetical protein
MLVFGAERLDATTDDDFGAGEFACAIRFGSQGSKSSLRSFMNRMRAPASFGTSAAVGSYSSQSPSGPTMVTRSTRSPASDHIGDHAERCDHLDLVCRDRDARLHQDGTNRE